MTNPELEYYQSGDLRSKSWLIRDDGHPSNILYYMAGDVKRELWYTSCGWHRIDGPAQIFYDINGNIEELNWYLNGENYTLKDWCTETNNCPLFMKLMYT